MVMVGSSAAWTDLRMIGLREFNGPNLRYGHGESFMGQHYPSKDPWTLSMDIPRSSDHLEIIFVDAGSRYSR
jgi:hypothetical protein